MQPKSDQKSESDSSLIILASGSESRKIMLTDAGLSFDVMVSDVDEDALKTLIGGMPFEKQVIELAKAKAEVISKQNPNAFVIGGDQMCVMGNEIFHKPGSQRLRVHYATLCETVWICGQGLGEASLGWGLRESTLWQIYARLGGG